MQMKAIVYTKYGPAAVLQLREVAKPVPEDNQVLVKVLAASANALDFRRFEKTSSWAASWMAYLSKPSTRSSALILLGGLRQLAQP